MDRPSEVVVVGAGVAGLRCAGILAAGGMRVSVLEASDDVGGRIRTDVMDGFRLDRGFQVLLTAYTECREALDYDDLDLRAFYPGSLVFLGGRLRRMADPWRRPLHALASLTSPVGRLGDYLRVARLRRDVVADESDPLREGPRRSSLEALEARGFSEEMIDRFFRPFFGGVFLERELATSERMLRFLFRMFAVGDTALPSAGMSAIPSQLAAKLPPGTVRTATPVIEVSPGKVRVDGGEELTADAVVVAADGPGAASLLTGLDVQAHNATTCLYFDAPAPPVREPLLVLDGEGAGPVNHLCVPSQVAPDYAPPGRALVSANVVGEVGREPDLELRVRNQLRSWFGGKVDTWRHLRTYTIPHALPAFGPEGTRDPGDTVRWKPGVFVCGDHRENGSIQGAMVSGRRAAEAVLEERGDVS
jgi:phytoene dehydrogenase-like protein